MGWYPTINSADMPKARTAQDLLPERGTILCAVFLSWTNHRQYKNYTYLIFALPVKWLCTKLYLDLWTNSTQFILESYWLSASTYWNPLLHKSRYVRISGCVAIFQCHKICAQFLTTFSCMPFSKINCGASMMNWKKIITYLFRERIKFSINFQRIFPKYSIV